MRLLYAPGWSLKIRGMFVYTLLEKGTNRFVKPYCLSLPGIK